MKLISYFVLQSDTEKPDLTLFICLQIQTPSCCQPATFYIFPPSYIYLLNVIEMQQFKKMTYYYY